MGLAEQRILPLWNAGRRDEAEWELGRLGLLAFGLSEIEKAAPEILNRLVQLLLSHDAELYFGTWQEVAIAASLLGRGEKLEHEPPGGPDFLVRGSGVGVECTSVHIAASLTATDLFVMEPEEPGERDLSYKLVSKIREKATRP